MWALCVVCGKKGLEEVGKDERFNLKVFLGDIEFSLKE
jgi:hypothetical protein